jgi:hypothetical protein
MNSPILRHILLFTLGLGGIAQAQSGSGSSGCSLGPGLECYALTANEGTGLARHNWLRAVLLWRRLSDERLLRGADTTLQREIALRQRQARRAAEDSGRVFLSGSSSGEFWHASYSAPARHGAESLYVAGHRFALPRRDSALVVMIEGLDGGTLPPSIVGTAWMPAELEDAYWPKFWVSGDTSFSVRPRRQPEILRAALSGVDAVRVFLGRAP